MFKTRLNFKKAMLGFMVTASLSVGGVTAFAATSGLASTAGATLTAAGPVDMSKINVQKGTLKVVKELDPNLLGELTGTTTTANVTMEAVPLGELDISNVKAGQIKIFKKLDPKKIAPINNEQSLTTAKK